MMVAIDGDDNVWKVRVADNLVSTLTAAFNGLCYRAIVTAMTNVLVIVIKYFQVYKYHPSIECVKYLMCGKEKFNWDGIKCFDPPDDLILMNQIQS